MSEAEVALEIIGRNSSLVGEEDAQPIPGKSRGRTQGLVHGSGCRATRQRDGQRTGASQPPKLAREESCGDAGEAVIRNDEEAGLAQLPLSPAVTTGAAVPTPPD